MINLSKCKFYELRESKKVFPVIFEAHADELTPIIIFYNLEGKNRCLLESALATKDSGRYSFMAENPYLQVNSYKDRITIISDDGSKIQKQGDVLDTVRDILNLKYHAENISLPFSGGAIGYVGYDVIRQYEVLPDKNKDKINIPEAYLLFYKTIICYDHYNHKLYIIYNVLPEDNLEYEEVVQLLQTTYEKIRVRKELHPLKREGSFGEAKSNFTKEEFCKRVNKAKDYITKGDIFQVVLSQRLTINTEENPFEVYRRLRSKNPSPYLFYIEFDGFEVVGSSPERLVSVINNIVSTNPIAGTRPRGKNSEEDKVLAEDLLKDEKEIAEHVMLVDLGRNDTGRISEFGTVKVEKFMEVELYSHVMHLVSKVTGRLKEGLDCFDALKVCLPAGTVSGAPKIRAMEIIDELENIRRGIYAGALGYFSYEGNMDVCIAIRTVIFKNKTAYLQAGAGIVYDSDPVKEYEETINKAKALRVVI
ncbi:anthranilate synthase component I [Clostridium sp. SYSU_GA19001]|uniref:anthranilate synthase component I n=1 Tax=Clostridium caldaquaticum TaxID=2940653 RepID=UPI00207789E6|nr:anthranilate synthase component I [Clostridium caldaquaticum]MCM8710142.1 anthranilate synthase component I [Clostridium caldaquaticum]